ncbi:hypothetical protein BVC80_9099g83 [Macleaya cordata]|uniref:Uncharacterized protein n=1 Tax=Macleaya cordata TaxID=56857 RepID=A0A200PVR8_MACCD|nr:hypothetical protein BVC80_9099g83 [Macleaya cordata]
MAAAIQIKKRIMHPSFILASEWILSREGLNPIAPLSYPPLTMFKVLIRPPNFISMTSGNETYLKFMKNKTADAAPMGIKPQCGPQQMTGYGSHDDGSLGEVG